MGVLRTDYFDAGLATLSETGYTSLKLAEVCRRLGVTSGSFYHYFPSWEGFIDDLIDHWKTISTTALIEWARDEPDHRRRIDRLIHIGLHLDHQAEAAMRAWGSVNAAVHDVHVEIDALRHAILREAAAAVVGDDLRADLFARWAVYLLVGYEQCTLPTDLTALEWIVGQLAASLDSARKTSEPVPGDPALGTAGRPIPPRRTDG